MNDISRIFKSIKLDKYKQDTTCLYDPIRHLLVQKTPEEEVRQKTIKFLQDELGVPVDRVLVEESMSHVKKGARGRADIVVYRDDERKDALMVVECKAPHIDVYCDDVLEQAERYRKIVKADYVMLINGNQVAIYQSKKEKHFEVENIPTYQDLLDNNLAFVEKRIINPYTYEQIMLKELQEKFYDCGYFGDDTPENKKGFYLNLLNLILLKEDTNKLILRKLVLLRIALEVRLSLVTAVEVPIKYGRDYLLRRIINIEIKCLVLVYVVQLIPKMMNIGELDWVIHN